MRVAPSADVYIKLKPYKGNFFFFFFFVVAVAVFFFVFFFFYFNSNKNTINVSYIRVTFYYFIFYHKLKGNFFFSFFSSIVQELCESRGGRPELAVLTSLLVSVDVKLY